MSKAIDIMGQRFGRLTALKPTKNRNSKGSIIWLCECDCGTIKEICITDLRNKGTKSCGCLSREKASQRFKKMTKEERFENAMKDITGQRFGKLVAIKPTDKRVGTNIIWEMKCDCGNTTYVHTGNLGEAQRKIKSCGCLHIEVVGVDLVGNRYGRLKVIKRSEQKESKSSWLCECSCGEVTIVQGTHLNSGATRSCGCLQIELSSGKNNHNYNPNKTDEERLKKRYVLGKQPMTKFRDGVYERDEYTCQTCGKVGGKLNAHHLDGWNWATNKRFDISNGITLCEKCHNKFHNTYGKGQNTKEQYVEFNRDAGYLWSY